MLTKGRLLAATENLAVSFRRGWAEATGLADAAFDLVLAGQSWHWFDRAAAAAEAWRLLTPAGHLLICHFDWIPLKGNVVAATERLIEAHNPAWPFGGGSGIYPEWLGDVAEAGFAGIEAFSRDLVVPYSHEAWRGRIRASAGIGGSLSPSAVTRFDDELARLLARDYADTPLDVPHRLWAMLARKP